MEILYIYIHDYKKIQKQNINFGGKYRFHYDYESKELTVSENHQHIEGFYDKHSDKKDKKDFARITNVTSIIGENGVGKTTILDFIYENFVIGGTIQVPMICATSFDGLMELHYYQVEIGTHNCDKHSIKFLEIRGDEITIKEEKTGGFIDPRFDKSKNTDFIFLSNIFDNRNEIELNGLRNISTNYLVRNDLGKGIEQGYFTRNDSALETHRFRDIHRQIEFINSHTFSEKRISFNLPDELTVNLTRNKFSASEDIEFRLKRKLEDRKLLEDYTKIRFGINRCLGTKKTEISNFIEAILANAFLNFLEEFFVLDSEFFGLKMAQYAKELTEYFDLTSDISIHGILKKSVSSLSVFKMIELQNYFSCPQNIMTLQELLNKRSSLLKKATFVLSDDITFLKFDIKETEFLKELSSVYLKTFIHKPYLIFDWRNLSSGEKAILNIYSRFYSLVDDAKFSDDLSDNLIILMDEPDTDLHPQWQKTLLNSLLDFLPEIYGRKDADGKKVKQRNIQIIFTTNNPISASDMLASNTIFMKLENNKVHIQDSLTDQRQTFGANIYSLYADSFFIQDGLMGKFASEKINAIIKNLNSLKPLDAKERETMRKTILQIGEPAIKNKLIQMYSDRYNLDIHERLDNLENNLNKDGQDRAE